jgi:hypothetical protein
MIVLPGPAFIVIRRGWLFSLLSLFGAAKLLKRARKVFKRKGACVECGKPIDQKRVAASSAVTLCPACQRVSDGQPNPPSLQMISD